MESLGHTVRQSVRELEPGTKDKLIFWGASTVGTATASGAWLLL